MLTTTKSTRIPYGRTYELCRRKRLPTNLIHISLAVLLSAVLETVSGNLRVSDLLKRQLAASIQRNQHFLVLTRQLSVVSYHLLAYFCTTVFEALYLEMLMYD